MCVSMCVCVDWSDVQERYPSYVWDLSGVRALAAVVSDENNARGVSVPAVDSEARQSCRSVCDMVFRAHSKALLCLTKTSTLGMSQKSPVFLYVHCCWRVWVARVGVCFEQTHRAR